MRDFDFKRRAASFAARRWLEPMIVRFNDPRVLGRNIRRTRSSMIAPLAQRLPCDFSMQVFLHTPGLCGPP